MKIFQAVERLFVISTNSFTLSLSLSSPAFSGVCVQSALYTHLHKSIELSAASLDKALNYLLSYVDYVKQKIVKNYLSLLRLCITVNIAS